MEINLDGEVIHCEADLHRILRDKLDFGPYYGDNLAALRESLSTDVERPVTLIWRNSRASGESFGNELFDPIVSVFHYVEDQDKTFRWEERFTFVAQ